MKNLEELLSLLTIKAEEMKKKAADKAEQTAALAEIRRKRVKDITAYQRQLTKSKKKLQSEIEDLENQRAIVSDLEKELDQFLAEVKITSKRLQEIDNEFCEKETCTRADDKSQEELETIEKQFRAELFELGSSQGTAEKDVVLEGIQLHAPEAEHPQTADKATHVNFNISLQEVTDEDLCAEPCPSTPRVKKMKRQQLILPHKESFFRKFFNGNDSSAIFSDTCVVDSHILAPDTLIPVLEERETGEMDADMISEKENTQSPKDDKNFCLPELRVVIQRQPCIDGMIFGAEELITVEDEEDETSWSMMREQRKRDPDEHRKEKRQKESFSVPENIPIEVPLTSSSSCVSSRPSCIPPESLKMPPVSTILHPPASPHFYNATATASGSSATCLTTPSPSTVVPLLLEPVMTQRDMPITPEQKPNLNSCTASPPLADFKNTDSTPALSTHTNADVNGRKNSPLPSNSSTETPTSSKKKSALHDSVKTIAEDATIKKWRHVKLRMFKISKRLKEDKIRYLCSRSSSESEGKKQVVSDDGPSNTMKKSFTCKECARVFTDNSSLKRHLRDHTGYKPYTCEVCCKRFFHKGHLKQHLRVHTGEKPFTCEVCSKGFSEKGNLKRHFRQHTKEKPFVCEICSKAFSRNSYLNTHRRTHTGEKPYSCDVCSKAFTTNHSLKKHLKTHSN